MMTLHEFTNTEQLNAAFASQLISLMQQAISKRGQAHLVVSGGRTPQALFQTLAQTELAWHKVTILLADDRYLPPDAPDSNERLVKASLLQHKAATANFISLYALADSASAAVPEITQRLADMPTFDAVILGMGEDGHTASLFPCSAQLAAGLADDAPPLLAVQPTTAPYARISLSKTRLLNSRQLFLHLVGANKLTVLEQAMASSDVNAMPIRAFLQHPAHDVAVMYSAN